MTRWGSCGRGARKWSPDTIRRGRTCGKATGGCGWPIEDGGGGPTLLLNEGCPVDTGSCPCGLDEGGGPDPKGGGPTPNWLEFMDDVGGGIIPPGCCPVLCILLPWAWLPITCPPYCGCPAPSHWWGRSIHSSWICTIWRPRGWHSLILTSFGWSIHGSWICTRWWTGRSHSLHLTRLWWTRVNWGRWSHVSRCGLRHSRPHVRIVTPGRGWSWLLHLRFC